MVLAALNPVVFATLLVKGVSRAVSSSFDTTKPDSGKAPPSPIATPNAAARWNNPILRLVLAVTFVVCVAGLIVVIRAFGLQTFRAQLDRVTPDNSGAVVNSLLVALVALITTILNVLVTSITSWTQQAANHQLEIDKANYLAVLEEKKSYLKDMENHTIETLKSRLAIELDHTKAGREQSQIAFRNLHKAVVIYYRRLSSLELGIWDEEGIRQADEMMILAEAESFLRDPEASEKFGNFWQAARNVSARARTRDVPGQASARSTEEETYRALWKQSAPGLGAKMQEFQAIAMREIYSSNKSEPAKSSS